LDKHTSIYAHKKLPLTYVYEHKNTQIKDNSLIRKALLELTQWLTQANRKPLVLRGVRQSSKTWLVRELAKSQNKQLIDPVLYYWQREGQSNAEIDYVIQYNNNIIPVEPRTGCRNLVLINSENNSPMR
jgi:predicted AAA+ superfamily ATPase